MFNNPQSACRTCIGLGTYRQVHPTLLVPDPKRIYCGGGVRQGGVSLQSGDVGRQDDVQPVAAVRILAGDAVRVAVAGGYRIAAARDAAARSSRCFSLRREELHNMWVGRRFGLRVSAREIERSYRRYRQKQEAHSHMEN